MNIDTFLTGMLKSTDYLGEIILGEDGILSYNSAPGLTGKEVGDIVYFFIVDGVLRKIGSASGKRSWIGRMYTYRRVEDRTSTFVIEDLKKVGSSKIDVLYKKIPREMVEEYCPFSDKIVKKEYSHALSEEKRLQRLYTSLGGELTMCKQKS